MISAHNAKILRKNKQNTEKSCNCRKKNECPLNGECLTTNVIYQAKIVTNQPKPESHIYLGLLVNFKDQKSQTNYGKKKIWKSNNPE